MTDVPALPSYVSGVSEVPLLGDTIGDNFDRTVARHGDREVLVDRRSGRRWTYSQLRLDVDAMARGLLACGIGKGDRVGIWVPNCQGGPEGGVRPGVRPHRLMARLRGQLRVAQGDITRLGTLCIRRSRPPLPHVAARGGEGLWVMS